MKSSSKNSFKVLMTSGILSAVALLAIGCNKTSPQAELPLQPLEVSRAPVATGAPMDEDTASGTTSGDAPTPNMTPAPEATPGSTPIPNKMDSKKKKAH